MWLCSKKQHSQIQAAEKHKDANGDGGLRHGVLQAISASALQRHSYWIQWDHLRSRKPSWESNTGRIRLPGSVIQVFKNFPHCVVAGLSLVSLSHAHSPVCTAQCVCLAWCSPYVCVFLCCSQDTRGLGQATDTHVGLAEPKDRAAQLPLCGQAVWHKGRYHLSAHILVLHRHIYAPNVSLSLDIATSSSADKDLLWGCFSVQMTGGNEGLI